MPIGEPQPGGPLSENKTSLERGGKRGDERRESGPERQSPKERQLLIHQFGRNLLKPQSEIHRSEPRTLESRSAQPGRNVGRPAHNVPDQSAAVILNHEHYRALVDAKVIRGDPPPCRTVRDFVCLVERRFKTVAL